LIMNDHMTTRSGTSTPENKECRTTHQSDPGVFASDSHPGSLGLAHGRHQEVVGGGVTKRASHRNAATAHECVGVNRAGIAPLGKVAAAPALQTGMPQADANGTGRGKRQEDEHAVFGCNGAGSKALAALHAGFRRAGLGLLELADGTLLATRWNCCKQLPDLYAATRFLHQIGGR
jgi:hypothetical protein